LQAAKTFVDMKGDVAESDIRGKIGLREPMPGDKLLQGQGQQPGMPGAPPGMPPGAPPGAAPPGAPGAPPVDPFAEPINPPGASPGPAEPPAPDKRLISDFTRKGEPDRYQAFWVEIGEVPL